MLDGLFMLLGLSVVMALASFLAGALPLSMSLSQSQLRLISTIGMGVLVGTSLIVIIPEGIEAVYSAGTPTHAHGERASWTPERQYGARWADGRNAPPLITPRRSIPRMRAREPADIDAFDALPGPVIPTSLPGAGVETEGSEPSSTVSHQDGIATEHPTPKKDYGQSDQSPPTFYVGLSLILGFVLMFLIDKLPRHASENLQAPPPTRHISLNNLAQGLHEPSPMTDGEDETESFLQSLAPNPKQTRSLATTTGLVIHAAADGIAMGASTTTSNTKLGFIIFIAIMVHKAPAAFGLTSVLLKQGLSKRAARGHLIIFSLAAPFGAISTWLLVHLLGGGGSSDDESGQWWTGMLLLFSAGTFLYVAMHAMQDDSSTHDYSASNGYVDGGPGSQRKHPRPQMRDTFAAVAGMMLPLLTQFGHHH